MKKVKRSLSLLMAVLMTFSLLPVFTLEAGAEVTEEQDTYANAWSVTMPTYRLDGDDIYVTVDGHEYEAFYYDGYDVDRKIAGTDLYWEETQYRVSGVKHIIVMIRKDTPEDPENPRYAIPAFTQSGTGSNAPWLNFTDLYIEEGITAIGNYAFYNQTSLNEVHIPMSVTSIGSYAFSGDAKLANINLRRVSSLGSYAFSGCTTLSKVSVGTGTAVNFGGVDYPDVTLRSIGNYAFYNARLKAAFLGDGPADGYAAVGSYAFYDADNRKMTTAVVGDNVSLGDCAFHIQTSLTYLTLGDNIKIGSSAFSYNYWLTNLDLSGVVQLGTSSFYDCYRLASVTLSSSLTTIPASCFRLTALTGVTIPASVTSIGNYAFAGASGINGTTSDSPSRKLTSVTFAPGSRLTTIGDGAFYKQALSGGLTLPESVTTINKYAFYNNSNMGAVEILSPRTVTIGERAFDSCMVTDLTIAATDRADIGSFAFAYNYIRNIDIATTGTLNLGANSFYYHRYLAELTLNADVLTIGSYAFAQTNDVKNNANFKTLTSVTLNGSQISIGNYAFYYNMVLSELSMPNITSASQLTLGTHAFGHSEEDAYTETDVSFEVLLQNGSTTTLSGTRGILITLGNVPNVPATSTAEYVVGFRTGINYFAGNNFKLIYNSTTPATCTEPGVISYNLVMNGDATAYIYNKPIPALGHDYGNSLTTYDANCARGEYTVETCQREGCNHRRITETGYSTKLNHEYYAGVLYKKTVEFSQSEYEAYLAGRDNAETDFVVWWKTSDGLTEVRDSVYQTMDAEDQATYTQKVYKGTVFYTASEYAALSSPDGYTQVNMGQVVYSTSDDGSVTVGEGSNAVTYRTIFNDYKTVYIEYDCYRDNHSGAILDNNFNLAYIPDRLTGTTEQTLADIELNNETLTWKDPSQSLAGSAGKRYFTAIFTPPGDGVSYYKPVELQIPIQVSRVELSLTEMTFRNTTLSTNSSNKAEVTVVNKPEGVTVGSPVYKSGTTTYTWAQICAMTGSFSGTVELSLTYDDRIYDLIAARDDTDTTYWDIGGNQAGRELNLTDAVSDFTAVASGYSVKSVTADGDTVTVVLSHAYSVTPPSLEIVEAVGETAVYDGEAHGFTLTQVPVGSTVTWQRCDENGGNPTGTASTLTLPAATGTGSNSTAYSDLRTVTIPTADWGTGFTYTAGDQPTAVNAGTYYYRVTVTNSAYGSGVGSSSSYVLTVPVTIAKQALTVPAGAVCTYDGTEHVGVEENTLYSRSGTYAATAANADGTNYTATVTLTQAARINYKWAGQEADAVEVNWHINKREVAVPTLSVTKLAYTGGYQTPLNFAAVDTVENDTPKTGDFKYEWNSAAKYYVVSVWLNGWVEAYKIFNANAYSVGTHTITSKFDGTTETLNTNFRLPNQAETLSLGSWSIEAATLALPTLTIPAVEYTGEAVTFQPTWSGTWDRKYLDVNGTERYVFDRNAALSYEYKTFGANDSAYTTTAPTAVGLYEVRVNVANAKQDASYTLPANYVTTTANITKRQITVTDAEDAAVTYNGGDQTLPAVTFKNKDGEAISLPADVTLYYYPAKTETTTVTDEDTGETTTVTSYVPDPDKTPLTSAQLANAGVGTYLYVVGIDPDNESYESVNYGKTQLTVAKATSTTTVQIAKADQNSTAELTSDGNGSYTLTVALGDSPETLTVSGLDPAASITCGAPSSSNVTTAYADGRLTLTFAAVNVPAEDTTVVISAGNTANAVAASATLTVKINKAVAGVTASVKPAAVTYHETQTVSAQVTGVAGVTAPASQTCTFYYLTAAEFTNNGFAVGTGRPAYTDAQLARLTNTTQPTTVGSYYVIAKYSGDSNYEISYSQPVPFSIGNAALTVTADATVTGTYNGGAYSVVNNLVVKGTGGTTMNTGYTVWYSAKQTAKVTDFSQITSWSTTAPTPTDVADSGWYCYKVTADNYDPAFGCVHVTISRKDLTVNADGLSMTKTYDGTDVLKTAGGAASCTIDLSGYAQFVRNEISAITVTGKYDGGKNVTSGGNVTVTYTVTQSTGFKAGNYTMNGKTFTGTAYTDGTTYDGMGTINAKAITVTGVTATNRAYNALTTVTLTGSPTTADAVSGETVTVTLKNGASGTITESGAAVTDPKPGTYAVAISPDQVSITDNNYTVAAVGAQIEGGSLVQPQVTISKQQLTLNYGGKSANSSTLVTGGTLTGVTYTGNALADADYRKASVTGKPTGGKSAAAVSYTFSSSVDGSFTDTVPSGAGTWFVKATLPDNDYYLGAVVVSSIVIAPASLGVTATALNITYDAAEHDPVASMTVTGVGGSAIAAEDYTVTYAKAPATGYKTAPEEIAEAVSSWSALKAKNVADSGMYYYKVEAENYAPAYGVVNAVIGRQMLTFSLSTNNSATTWTKVYDGSKALNSAAQFTVTVTGEAGNEVITSAATAADAEYETAAAGTNKKVYIWHTLSISGTDYSAWYDNYCIGTGTLLTDNGNGTAKVTTTKTGNTINKKPITVTGVDAVDRSYNGEAGVTLEVASGAGLSSEDLVTGDTVTFALTEAYIAVMADANVGTDKAVTVTPTGNDWNALISLTGAAAGNYTVAGINTVDVTISKAAPRIVFDNPQDTEPSYTSNPITADYEYVTVYGAGAESSTILAEDDAALLSYTYYKNSNKDTLDNARTDVGSSYYVYVEFAGTGNYTALSAGVTRTIQAQSLNSFGGGSNNSQVFLYGRGSAVTYDGKEHDILDAKKIISSLYGDVDDAACDPQFASVVYVAKLTAEEATAAGNDALDWSKLANRWQDVTTVKVKNVADSGTYGVKVFSSGHAELYTTRPVTITPATLTITNNIGSTRVYDDTTVVPVTSGTATTATVTGQQTGDTVSANVTASYDNENAGTNKTVTAVYTMSFSGSDVDITAGNYTYRFGESGTAQAFVKPASGSYTVTDSSIRADITRRQIYVNGVTAVDRQYNGNTAVDLTGTLTTTGPNGGLVTGDEVQVSLVTNATGTVQTADVGSKTVTIPMDQVQLTGTANANYEIIGVNNTQNSGSTTVDITARELSITGFGPTLSAVNYTAAPLADSAYKTGLTLAVKAAVTVGGSSTDAAGVAADLSSKKANVVYTYWTDENCQTPAVGSSSSTVPTDAGTYYIKAALAAAGNYGGVEQVAQITINRNSFTVTPAAYTLSFDGQTHALKDRLTIAGLQTGESGTPSYTFVKKVGDETKDTVDWTRSPATGFTDVADNGVYFYKVSIPNYNDVTGSVTVNMARAALTLAVPENKALNSTRAYNAATAATFGQAQEASVDAVVSGAQNETVSAVITASFDSKAAGTGKTITLAYALSSTSTNPTWYDNYTVDGTALTGASAVQTKSGAISKKDITVSGVDAADRQYDGTTAVILTGTQLTGVGVENGDTVSFALTDAYTAAAAAADVGTRAVTVTPTGGNFNKLFTLTGADKDNYNVTGINAVDVAISKRTLTMTYTGGTAVYTGSAMADTAFKTATLATAGNTYNADAASVAEDLSGSARNAIGYRFYTRSGDTYTPVAVPTAAGTYYVTATLDHSNYSADAVTYAQVSITKADLTVTADNYSAVYDGTGHTDAIITGVTGTTADGTGKAITGYTVYFHKVTGSETCAQVSDWAAASTFPLKDVAESGSYFYKVSYANHEDAFGSFTVSITRAPLTLSVTLTDSRTYTAGTEAAVTAPTVSGQQNGENITATATAAYSDKNVGSGKTITVTYTMDFHGVKSDNYTYNGASSAVGTNNVQTQFTDAAVIQKFAGSISQKSISVTDVTAATRAYDGTKAVTLAGTPKTNDKCTDDELTLSLVSGAVGTAADKDVGERTVTITTGQISLSGADASNYKVGSVNTPTVTISKATPSVTFPASITMAYTGNAMPKAKYTATVTGVQSEAMTNGDEANSAMPGTVSYLFKDRTADDSTYTAEVPVNLGEYTVKATYTQAATDNYATVSNTAELSITASSTELTVTSVPYSKDYDGSSHSLADLITAVSGNGGETPSYTVSFYKSPADRAGDENAVTSFKDVADSQTYYFRITTANYPVFDGSVSVAVNKRELCVTRTLVSTRGYNGTAAANAPTGISLDGIQNSENITVALSSSTYNSADVVTADTITTVYTVTFGSGSDANNYKYVKGSAADTGSATSAAAGWTVTETQSGSITKAAVSAKIKDQTAVYTNEEPTVGQAESTNWEVTGTVYSQNSTKDDLKITLTKASGVQVSEYVITGVSANTNYTVTFTNGTYTITRRSLNIRIADTNGYYGETPVLTTTLLTNEGTNTYGKNESITTVRDLVTAARLRTGADSTKDVGAYDIYVVNADGSRITGGDYGNYTVTFTDGSYTVKQREITVTPVAKTKVYGQTVDSAAIGGTTAENTDYTVTLDGKSGQSGSALVNGDTLTVVLSTKNRGSDLTFNSDAGAYTITVASAVVNNNYRITSSGTASYTVNQAEARIYLDRGSQPQSTVAGTSYTNIVKAENISVDPALNATDDSAGVPFDGSITYASSDESILTVDPTTGEVTPVGAAGTQATITATVTANGTNYKTVNGETEKTLSYTLLITDAGTVTLSFSVRDKQETGSDIKLVDTDNGDSITYTNPTSGVTVQYRLVSFTNTEGVKTTYANSQLSDNVPTGKAPGIYEIGYSATAGNAYAPATGIITVRINAKPVFAVTFLNNGGKFAENAVTSFTRKQGEALTAADFPAITRTGYDLAGWKLGEETKTAAQWEGKTVSEAMLFTAQWTRHIFTVTLAETDFTYDGTAKRPAATVTENETDVTDCFAVTYTNNVTVGTATATLVGIGDYLGIQFTETFTISQATAAVSFALSSVSKIQGAENFTVTAATEPAGLSLRYSSSNSQVASVNAATGEVTVVGAGTAAITAELTDTHNYRAASASYELHVGKTFTVDPIASQSYTGGALTPVVVVKDGDTVLTRDQDYTITYAAADMIEVGTYSVTVTGKGSYGGTAEADFRIDKANAGASFAESSLTKIFGSAAFTNSLTVTPDTLTVNYTSSNTGVAAVDAATGEVVIVGAGTAEITAAVTGNGSYNGTSAKFTLTVDPKTLTSGMLSAIPDQTLTGSAIEPAVTVQDGSRILVKGTDYTVKYADNTDVGTAQVTVTGKGNYTGTLNTTFKIVTVTTPLTVTLSQSSWTYTGNDIEPGVTVKQGGKTLTKGTDYTVVYSDNVRVGTATVVVMGQGSYQGLAGSTTFTITQADQTVTFARSGDQTVVYGESFINPAAAALDTVTLSYASSDETVATVDSTTGAVTPLKAGTTRITASTAATANVGAGSAGYDLTVGKAAPVLSFADSALARKTTDAAFTNRLTVTPNTLDVTYTSSVPSVATVDDTGLVTILAEGSTTITAYTEEDDRYEAADTGYTLTVSNDTITYTAAGSTAVYDRAAHSISVSVITVGATVKYGESEGSYGLTEAPAYTDAGSYTVYYQITAPGYNTVTDSKTVVIAAKALTAAMTDAIPVQAYTGEAIEPTIVLRYLDEALTAGTDYTVAYTNNINPGAAYAVITGVKNYGGRLEIPFAIYNSQPTSAEKLTVIADETGAVTVSVKEGENTLTLDGTTDYTLLYQAVANDGTLTEASVLTEGLYKITATGTGDYAGRTGCTYWAGVNGITDPGIPVVFNSDEDSANLSNMVKVLTVTGGDLLDALVKLLKVDGVELENGKLTVELKNTADASREATGSAIEPEVIVTCDGQTLTGGTDYTVAYSNNIEPGEATITVTGRELFRGTYTLHFTIVEADPAPLAILGFDPTSMPLLTAGSGMSLMSAATYHITKVEYLDGGSATVVTEITNIGLYRVSISDGTNTYQILVSVVPKEIDQTDIVLSTTTFYYDTSAKTPGVTVKDGYQVLEEGNLVARTAELSQGTDYDITYMNNVNEGTGLVVIQGKGNYTGTAIATFSIQKAGSGDGGGNTQPIVITPADDSTKIGTKGVGEITVSMSEEGSYVISNNGHTYTFVAPEGYEIRAVLVDGKNVGAVKSYTFIDTKAHTLEIQFSELPCDGGDRCPSRVFTDVDTSLWYHEYLDTVLRKGLMNGTSDTTFSPYASTSRGMIVTILYRLAGSPAVAEPSSFTDVPAGAWFADAVSWSESNGVVLGYGDGTFGPNDPITREQLAAILYRFADCQGWDMSAGAALSAFADQDKISSWALEAVRWTVGVGLMEGKDGDRLAPEDTAQRCETAAMITRFMALTDRAE